MYKIKLQPGDYFHFISPEYSDWECTLFGGSGVATIRWRPEKGKEPNRFWMFMQFICFGNRWVNTKKQTGDNHE